MKITHRSIFGLAAAAMLLSSTAFAQDADKLIWGGGDIKTSTYSNVYVPRVIDVLNQNRMAGYAWAGPSDGTLQNAEKVTDNPANLALGQYDLLKDLNGKPIPDQPGKFYKFSTIASDIGPECLYLVTKAEGYNSFGDFLNNAWDSTVATGGPLSGSFGTFRRLQSIYPQLSSDLPDSNIITTDSNGKGLGANAIVDLVAGDKATHGFFVMRPDPASETFKKIADLHLHIIPVVDFDIEGAGYTYQDLKVAYGGFLGFGGNDQFLTTACTSVALITGDPSAIDPSNTRLKRRVDETVKRLSAVPADDLKPNLANWQDMWNSIKLSTVDNTKALMEASKKAIDDYAKTHS